MQIDLVDRIIKYKKPNSELDFVVDNGVKLTLKRKTQSITLTAANPVTVSNFIPDGAIVMGLSARVTTVVGTGGDRTTVAIDDGSINFCAATMTSQVLAKDTIMSVATGTMTGPKTYTAATDLNITASGGSSGDFTAGGVIRVSMLYFDLGAPTS